MSNNAYSYSDIATFRRCPKKYEYTKIEDIQPKRQNINLYQGILVHAALMSFYLGEDETKFWEAAFKAIETNPRLLSDEIITEQTVVEDSDDLVTRYLNTYNDDWEVLHVEEQFFVTLDTGEVISFTPDLIVRDRNGFVWIVDHKTTSALPSIDVYADLQAMLYYAGIKAMYPETRGFLFNYLRKKRPTVPRLTKTGKPRCADLNRIDTTPDLLSEFMEANDLMDDDMHRRRLGELMNQERFFWRTQLIIRDDQVERVLEEAAVTIGIMEALRQADVAYPRTFQEDRGYMSCGKCEMQRICQADLLNYDRELVLDESYEPRDPKNPYQAEGEDDASS